MPASHVPVVFTPRELAKGQAGFPYELKLISSASDIRELLTLRAAALRRAADGAADRAAEISDDTDACEQTVHFAVYHGGDCRGSARMTFKGWADPISVLPCAPYYPALQSAGLRKLSIAEMSQVFVDPGVSEPSQQTVLYSALARAALLAVQAARIAMLVAAVPPQWLALYTRLLRFHPIGAPARYPPASTELTLVGGNMIGAGRRDTERNAFFQTLPAEVASMREALLRCLGNAPHTRVLSGTADGPLQSSR